MSSVKVGKVQGVASCHGHDCALGVYSWRVWQHAGIVNIEIFETVNFAKRIGGAVFHFLTNRAGGEGVNGGEAQQ